MQMRRLPRFQLPVKSKRSENAEILLSLFWSEKGSDAKRYDKPMGSLNYNQSEKNPGLWRGASGPLGPSLVCTTVVSQALGFLESLDTPAMRGLRGYTLLHCPPSTNQRAVSQLSLKSKFQLHPIQKKTLGTLPGSPRNNQSPPCLSANSEYLQCDVVSNIKDYSDMGFRTASESRYPQINSQKLLDCAEV
ncbi:hypothetical protein TNCV_1435011 [Trichonephila clavipes]|nr:hypothetical protein TNCV_1435011 [Trichonephila clavipes]